MKQYIVFSDVDGTLIDDSYSFSESLPVIQSLRGRGIPLVLVSSKTKAEILAIRKEIGNKDPFVVENGAAVYIPKGYFEGEEEAGYVRIPNAKRNYTEVCDILDGIRNSTKITFTCFHDLNSEQVAELTGLSKEAAERAKEREGSEVLYLKEVTKAGELAKVLDEYDLVLESGTRFFHVHDSFDKGTGVGILINLFKNRYAGFTSLGVGDAENDIPMLKQTDRGYLIGNRKKRKDIKTVPKSGPQAFKYLIKETLSLK